MISKYAYYNQIRNALVGAGAPPAGQPAMPAGRPAPSDGQPAPGVGQPEPETWSPAAAAVGSLGALGAQPAPPQPLQPRPPAGPPPAPAMAAPRPPAGPPPAPAMAAPRPPAGPPPAPAVAAPRPPAGPPPALPGTSIQAAANWHSGKAYFFRNQIYWRYNKSADRADPGYPKSITSKTWPGFSSVTTRPWSIGGMARPTFSIMGTTSDMMSEKTGPIPDIPNPSTKRPGPDCGRPGWMPPSTGVTARPTFSRATNT